MAKTWADAKPKHRPQSEFRTLLQWSSGDPENPIDQTWVVHIQKWTPLSIFDRGWHWFTRGEWHTVGKTKVRSEEGKWEREKYEVGFYFEDRIRFVIRGVERDDAEVYAMEILEQHVKHHELATKNDTATEVYL